MKNLKYLCPYFTSRLLPAVFGFYVRKEEKKLLIQAILTVWGAEGVQAISCVAEC